MSAVEISKYRGPGLILLSALCFSTTGTSQALSPEGASPLVIGGVRLWVGCLFMLAWCFISKKNLSIVGWPLKRTIVSALGIVVYQLTFFVAVASTGVAIGTVVTCGSIPLVASIFGYILLKEKPPKIWYPATAAALLGLVFLSVTNNVETKPVGLLLAVCSGVAYALHIAFGKSLTQAYDPQVVVTVLFTIGGVVIFPVFIFFPTAWLASGQGALICLHLGLVTAAAGYSLYLAGLKHTLLSTATTINLSESLLAACWGIFLLGEQVTWLQILGMGLIFGSTVLLASRPGHAVRAS